MRIVRATVLVLSAITALIIGASGPVGAATDATNYVALGDSYSSGVGAGHYDPASGDCERSTRAYPQLWASEHASASFAFVACSGATTADVVADQVQALTASTTAVSITIGGNDAGFAHVMQTCILGSTADCDAAVSSAEKFIENTLPGRLDAVYASIRRHAPTASVVVLGYPRLYRLNGFCLFGLSDHKRAAIDAGADTLDTVIGKRAADAGFAFSDVRYEFSGHEICSGDSWLRSLTLPLTDSYHPTAQGQADGYLSALDAATS